MQNLIRLSPAELAVAEEYLQELDREAERLPRLRYFVLAGALLLLITGVNVTVSNFYRGFNRTSVAMGVFSGDITTLSHTMTEENRIALLRRMILLLEVREQESTWCVFLIFLGFVQSLLGGVLLMFVRRRWHAAPRLALTAKIMREGLKQLTDSTPASTPA